MVSEGENYPVGNININTAEDIAETNPAQIPNYVSDVYIQQSGFGYQSTDKGFDDFGNQYSITVDEDGSIVSVSVDSLITGTRTVQDTAGGGQLTPDLIPDLVPNLTTISSPPLIINNYIIVEDLPTITIESETGIGAILNPILEKLPIEVIKSNESSIRETKFVKDCIT